MNKPLKKATKHIGKILEEYNIDPYDAEIINAELNKLYEKTKKKSFDDGYDKGIEAGRRSTRDLYEAGLSDEERTNETLEQKSLYNALRDDKSAELDEEEDYEASL